MLLRVAITLTLATSASALGGSDEITQAELLHRIIDVNRFATPPTGVHTRLSTSRATDQQPEGEWRTLAHIGAGYISRFIAIAKDKSSWGTLRIEIDDQPPIEMPCDELFRGKSEPFIAPLVGLSDDETLGWCFFPIAGAKSVRLSHRGADIQFAVTRAVHTWASNKSKIEPFTRELNDPAKAMRMRVADALTNGLTESELFGGRRASPFSEQRDLKPGETFDYSVDDSGTIRALYIALTDRANPRELYALHNCVLRIRFDGEVEPSVECPLIDFFGSGFDLTRFNALVIGTDRELNVPLDRPLGEDRYFYCFYPMPYRSGAKIEIENRSGVKIGFMLYLRVDRTPPAAGTLRFHARYNVSNPLRETTHKVLSTDGSGYFVGLTLMADSPSDRAWLDCMFITSPQSNVGEKPALLDWLPWRTLLSARSLAHSIQPLAGLTRAGAYGKGSVYLSYIPDAIEFPKLGSCYLDFSAAAGRSAGAYIATIAYWYDTPGAKHEFAPLNVEMLRIPGLRIPGAVEIEGRVQGANWGNVVKQKYAETELSGEEGVSITATEPVKIIIPSAKAQTVKLKLRVNPRRSFETIEVSDAAGTKIGTVKYARSAHGIFEVGPLTLAAGDNIVFVKCSKAAVLDCWILDAQP